MVAKGPSELRSCCWQRVLAITFVPKLWTTVQSITVRSIWHLHPRLIGTCGNCQRFASCTQRMQNYLHSVLFGRVTSNYLQVASLAFLDHPKQSLGRISARDSQRYLVLSQSSLPGEDVPGIFQRNLLPLTLYWSWDSETFFFFFARLCNNSQHNRVWTSISTDCHKPKDKIHRVGSWELCWRASFKCVKLCQCVTS